MIECELGLWSQPFDGVEINPFEWNGPIHHLKLCINTAPSPRLHLPTCQGAVWGSAGWAQVSVTMVTGPKKDLGSGQGCADIVVGPSRAGMILRIPAAGSCDISHPPACHLTPMPQNCFLPSPPLNRRVIVSSLLAFPSAVALGKWSRPAKTDSS